MPECFVQSFVEHLHFIFSYIIYIFFEIFFFKINFSFSLIKTKILVFSFGFSNVLISF